MGTGRASNETGSFWNQGDDDFDQGENMKKLKIIMSAILLLAGAGLAGCSNTDTKSPDVSGPIRTSLDRAGLKDVSISQDRDKGVVTLGGHVASDNDKMQAESLARSIAGTQVVANQIAVLPPGLEKDAKAVNADLDAGIEKNLDAVLILNKLHDNVKYSVKNGVVTLTGDVISEGTRSQAGRLANGVPNVLQVVNSLQVKNQKATTPR
jgi:hyperosmotically inducible periplasmic protein